MRTPARALAAFALVATLPVPARAAVGQMTCTLVYPSFGTGTAAGTGTCTVVGTYAAPLQMTFTYVQPPATCPVQETATGTLTGPGLRADFTWTLLARSGNVQYAWPYTMAGPMTAPVTSPVGNPCGGPATATATLPLP